MKTKKSNLDEMQEQELLKVEHNGCWIAYWGLLAAIAVQGIVCRDLGFRAVAGEWVLLIVLSVYLSVACMRRGIWDRRIPMNAKSNALVSAVAAAAFGLFTAAAISGRSDRPSVIVIGALISAAVVFVLCFITLNIFMKKTAKRKEQLEEEPENADSI